LKTSKRAHDKDKRDGVTGSVKQAERIRILSNHDGNSIIVKDLEEKACSRVEDGGG
jgi:hypothetical protein